MKRIRIETFLVVGALCRQDPRGVAQYRIARIAHVNPALEQTLIVLPALNEEASIAEVIREVKVALPTVRCLVVDDGSTDRTAEVARSAGALVLSLPYNLGVGG